jgi:putative ABC transport system substrate-binding protein
MKPNELQKKEFEMNAQMHKTFFTLPKLAGWLLLLVALLLAACGAAPPKSYTIGVVNFSPALDPVFDGFKAGMTEAGYVEGENVTYIYGGAVGSIDALDPAIAELMGKQVDLILSLSTPATQKIKQATAGKSIPVVFGPVTDPVGSEIVTSLKNPGGNLTGVQNRGSIAKGLYWLQEMAPGTTRLYVPHNPDDSSSVQGLEELREAATNLNMELEVVEVNTEEALIAALESIPEETDAIFMLPSGFFSARTAIFVEAASAHMLPLQSVAPQAQNGVLMSYGHNYFQMGKQLSRLADQILNGTAPANLPVEVADFYLNINLKSAQAIDLDIPDDVLAQADTIIR